MWVMAAVILPNCFLGNHSWDFWAVSWIHSYAFGMLEVNAISFCNTNALSDTCKGYVTPQLFIIRTSFDSAVETRHYWINQGLG